MQDYVFRIEPTERTTPVSPESFRQALQACGIEARSAVRTGYGWCVHVSAKTGVPPTGMVPPAGWKVVEVQSVLEQAHWPVAGSMQATGDIFTFALLLWPAVVGLVALPDQGWTLALKIALAIWLGVMHLVAYRQQGKAFFGNSMLMLSGCVAGFWWTHPGSWMYAWLLTILVGVYAVVRGALQGRSQTGAAANMAQSGRSG